jgi:isopentenyl-diphosphate delta-isomerase
VTLNQRKQDHLRILDDDPQTDRHCNFFDEIHLRQRALPGLDLADVDTSVEFMGKRLSFPLLISSMTGGAGDAMLRINRNLAQSAQAAGVAMGVGSQRVMLKDESAVASFMLRGDAPDILLFGNLGAVQLNNGISVDDCNRLVQKTGVDALCLHLNPLQEAVQPEGDTNFGGLVERIGELVDGLSVPVIVKEVGCGIGADDARVLQDAGVRYIDVAGRGGTSWSRIEWHRSHEDDEAGLVFQDWGLPTPEALRQLWQPDGSPVKLIASGGIRSGLDMVKAVVLGGSLCGIAGPFIARAGESAEAVIKYIEGLKKQFRIAMFLLGVRTVGELHGNYKLVRD